LAIVRSVMRARRAVSVVIGMPFLAS
jgi:hypothetical protein